MANFHRAMASSLSLGLAIGCHKGRVQVLVGLGQAIVPRLFEPAVGFAAIGSGAKPVLKLVAPAQLCKVAPPFGGNPIPGSCLSKVLCDAVDSEKENLAQKVGRKDRACFRP